ncbi:MAG: GPW/gp25 family protein [Deltaproteobacteria bacterium]|nr:GPW/gp25 family protein [Deltaproteobacteria bacterium]
MNTDNTFLGRGWGFPPTFNRNTGTVEMVSDEEDIVQSIQIILSTAMGERTMHPRFGCGLTDFLFEEIDQGLLGNLKSVISDAILNHEPRIDLNGVDITESEDRVGLLLISMDYTVRISNSRYNMVYPFYINEATDPNP